MKSQKLRVMKDHEPLKRILVVVKQEWQEKLVFILLDAHLSTARNHHVYVLFLQQKISDPASWASIAHHACW